MPCAKKLGNYFPYCIGHRATTTTYFWTHFPSFLYKITRRQVSRNHGYQDEVSQDIFIPKSTT